MKVLLTVVVIALPLLLFAAGAGAGAAQPHLIAPTTVSIVASPGSIVESQPFQVTATVVGSSGTPSGTVQIQAADGAVLCNIDLVGGTGTCSATPFLDAPGSNYEITGLYAGDSTYAPASGSTTVPLAPAATVTSLTSDSYTPQKFSLVTLHATIVVAAPASASTDVEGSVVFTDNGQPIAHCDGVVGAGDVNPYSVPCQINPISPGTHIYAAEYLGTSLFLPSESSPITVVSAAIPTTVTGTSETTSPVQGQKIFLAAGVFTGISNAVGEVYFSAGGLPLCNADVNAGSTGCYTTAEPVGTDIVTVSFYDVTGVYASSTSTFVLNVSASSPAGTLTSAVGMAANPAGSGYWIVDARGDVDAFGAAANDGSLTGIHLNAPITHIVSTPDGQGYWLVAADGGTFSFGDAQFYGSMGGKHLNAPVVDIAPTKDGRGYWLVASDGGIFAFGDAQFYGSMGGTHLNRPVVGIVADNATGGYWEVATDGGIFSFNAPFYGSTGNIHLNEPVIGMASTADDGGYLFVASDGGIFAYGDAGFFGSMGATKLAAPIVGMASDGATGGYWLVGADGGVFTFNAPFLGAH